MPPNEQPCPSEIERLRSLFPEGVLNEVSEEQDRCYDLYQRHREDFMWVRSFMAILLGALVTGTGAFAAPADGYKPAHITTVNLGSVLPPAPDSEKEEAEHEREEHEAKQAKTLYVVFRSPEDKRIFVAEMPCGATCYELRRELETHRDIQFKLEGKNILMQVNGKVLKARQHEEKLEKNRS